MSRIESIETFDYQATLTPIAQRPEGVSVLSIEQFEPADITMYLREAEYAGRLLASEEKGAEVLPFHVLGAIMRQPSTRTGGSMRTAMAKLGGTTGVISGMTSSSEAKGESLADSWLAFATQFDLIGTRTPEEHGPHYADYIIRKAFEDGKLDAIVPVINLGDGTNEHPTQTLGDLRTIEKEILDKRKDVDFSDLTITLVGDHERYRAFHSLMIALGKLGSRVIVIESDVARVPDRYVNMLGNRLDRTSDIEGAIGASDVLYMGRNPDEYQRTVQLWRMFSAEARYEKARAKQLGEDYKTWRIDEKRIGLMRPDAVLMHPRPRRDEIDPDIDSDSRTVDVIEMRHMIAARMAVVSLACGRSIAEKVNYMSLQR